jgi:glutamate synthase domain-containing protein 3
MIRIDAKGIPYKELNQKIREAVKNGEKEIIVDKVNGQRYIGDNLSGADVKITLNGVPGNDLAFTMDGPTIIINGNGQDGIGNTLGRGKIVIKGNAGDICGYAMRGGKIFIKGNVGYRSGIHMKEYQENFPIIIVGGRGGDFLGEYMAGGVLIVLGMHDDGKEIVGNMCGTGMHGGKMYIRGDVPDWRLGKEVKKEPLDEEDKRLLTTLLKEYKSDLEITQEFKLNEFIKLIPGSKRPYGRMYAY